MCLLLESIDSRYPSPLLDRLFDMNRESYRNPISLSVVLNVVAKDEIEL